MPITFSVDKTLLPQPVPRSTSILEHLASDLKENGGRLMKISRFDRFLKSRFLNGFVGACIYAYNLHLHLVLGPDEVWLAITSSLSRYINANPETIRKKFVASEAQLQLDGCGMVDLQSANFEALITQLSSKIEESTTEDMRTWIECNFSTTTPMTKMMSKAILGSSMQNRSKKETKLHCGLPQVTLQGTVEDWMLIQQRVKTLSTLGDATLSEWSMVLDLVIQQFIFAFTKLPKTKFWNRIARYTEGASEVRYLEGWVLAFVAFDAQGKYILDRFDSIRKTHKFGKMNTNEIPTSTVMVPVSIEDNGRIYNTLFYTGLMLPIIIEDVVVVKDDVKVGPTPDWAFVVLNAKEGPNEIQLPDSPFAHATVWEDGFVDEFEVTPTISKKSKTCIIS